MAIGTPVEPTHTLIVSFDPEVSRDLSGENIRCEWRLRMAISTPVELSHSLAVLSSDPEASQDPSGENKGERPSRVEIGTPEAPSQYKRFACFHVRTITKSYGGDEWQSQSRRPSPNCRSGSKSINITSLIDHSSAIYTELIRSADGL